MYSMPSDLITSTMKSAPGHSVVSTSAVDGFPASASFDIGGAVFTCAACDWEVCAAADTPPVASTAAPAAEPLMKSRRLMASFLDFPTDYPPEFLTRPTSLQSCTV